MGSVNWADLQKAAGDAAFEPVPAGLYNVYVDTAEAKKSSNDKDMINVKFKVVGGPHDKRTVFKMFVLTPDSPTALAFFFRHMAAMGLDAAYFDTNPSMEAVAVKLVGRPCRIKTSLEEYQGSDKARVDQVLPPEPGQAAGPSVPETSFGSMPAAPSVATPPAPVVTPQSPAAAPQVPVAPTVPQPIETPF